MDGNVPCGDDRAIDAMYASEALAHRLALLIKSGEASDNVCARHRMGDGRSQIDEALVRASEADGELAQCFAACNIGACGKCLRVSDHRPATDDAEKNVGVRMKTGGETMAMRRHRVCNVRS